MIMTRTFPKRCVINYYNDQRVYRRLHRPLCHLKIGVAMRRILKELLCLEWETADFCLFSPRLQLLLQPCISPCSYMGKISQPSGQELGSCNANRGKEQEKNSVLPAEILK